MKKIPEKIVWKDYETLSQAAAYFFVAACHQAVAKHGKFTVALSGGNTPKRFYDILASAPFNQNIPYDRFVITQLAGDLLPHPSFEDRIATSFHRQTAANDEGGTDDEEFRLLAVMDRASTTWSVLNGVSFNCVQCHSHPYDPIRHSEYYKFLAFFNTQRDADIAFDSALEDDWPVLHVPTDKADYGEADRLQRESERLSNGLVAASRAASSPSRPTIGDCCRFPNNASCSTPSPR